MWSNVIIEGDAPENRCKLAVALSNHDLYLYGGTGQTNLPLPSSLFTLPCDNS